MEEFDLKKYKSKQIYINGYNGYCFLVFSTGVSNHWQYDSTGNMLLLLTNGELLPQYRWEMVRTTEYKFKSKQELMKVLRTNYGRIRVREYQSN